MLFNIIFFLLCFALVAGSAVFAFSGNEDKSYLGFRFFNVNSQSMTPQPDGNLNGFHVDDIIVVRVVTDPYTIKTGDIITIHQPADDNLFLTHRVVDIRNDEDDLFFIMRGNTNNKDDPPVPSDYLVGKVVLVLPKMGSFLNYVRNHLVLVIIFIIALFFFSILVRSFLLSNAEVKRSKNRKTTERGTTK